MEPEVAPDQRMIAGIEITDEMVARIAKACGHADYRFESESDHVERVIFHLAAELERVALSLPRS